MKKIIVLFVLAGIMSSFRGPDPGTNRVLHGYKLKKQEQVFNDFNLWVITQHEAFENTFIAGDENSSKPSFDSEFVVAARVQTLENAYRIDFKKVSVSGTELNIHFHVTRIGKVERMEAPVALITHQKNGSLKKVNFYHDNILVKSVPIVSVY